jgi:DNA-binding protein HU-beta
MLAKNIKTLIRRSKMNKNELIESVADMNDMKKTDVKEVLNATLDMIKDCAAEGEVVELFGFGKFITVDVKARKGRNPQTGEELKISARTNVKFKPAKAFKDMVNDAN